MDTDDIEIRRDVMVPMRDGVRLRTDLYLPPSDEPLPTLLTRTPYSPDIAPMGDGALAFAVQGYAVVVQHVRGRYGSEGDFHPVHVDVDDGYDAVEWVAAQPWSNGRVGMYGGSYLGMTQWMAAIARPPHLTAIVPVASSPSFFGSTCWYWTPGVMAMGMTIGWSGAQTTWEAGRRGGEALPEFVAMEEAQRDMMTDPDKFLAAYQAHDALLQQLYAHRPLRDIETLREFAPWFQDWCDHASPDDEYYRAIQAIDQLDRVEVPVMHVAGWYDFFCQGGIDGFVAMRREGPPDVRDLQRLVVGPWNHVPGMPARADLPAEPMLGMYDTSPGSPAMAFYDRHLKGTETPAEDDPRIRLFVMGANRWRHEEEWPLPGTVWTRYHLHSSGTAATDGDDGVLSTTPPDDQPPDRFDYDPNDPVPGVSTHGLPGAPETAPEQQALRPDVAVYTTPPLDEGVEVTGPVTLQLWASSTAVDTDFTAKLLDVFPDGTVVPLCQGVLRASTVFPHGLVAGEVCRFEVGMWSTSNRFGPGHRIRLQVSSSEFPSYELNPNTGARITHDASGATVVASQQVFHDAQHPSHLLLPVIPAEGRDEEVRP